MEKSIKRIYHLPFQNAVAPQDFIMPSLQMQAKYMLKKLNKQIYEEFQDNATMGQ